MKPMQQFREAIKTEMTATLATASEGQVTMRMVSPVNFDGDILIFCGADSLKYRQLKENPNCCVAVGGFFAQATATFCGATMLENNRALREAYEAKFPGAFDEGLAFGGRTSEFVRLRPTWLTGWTFENDVPTADGIPNLPFSFAIGEE